MKIQQTIVIERRDLEFALIDYLQKNGMKGPFVFQTAKLDSMSGSIDWSNFLAIKVRVAG